MRISDWSSDVCSSDLRAARCDGGGRSGDAGRLCRRRRTRPRRPRRALAGGAARGAPRGQRRARARLSGRAGTGGGMGRECRGARDRKSAVEGKSVSVRVDLGGRRIIKKKIIINKIVKPLISKT